MYAKYFKRITDFLLPLIALILLSPIIVLTAILVRCKLGSPIIFKQKRPGKDEQIFTMYKFRSMTDQRDQAGELLPDEFRLTRFGKFLRDTSLDELPGLFNILKGDMSLVGPRPLASIYLPYYNDKERLRHTVRPGLTGLAQINGRNTTVWEDRFNYDIEYVQNITFRKDIKIIFQTCSKVIKRDGITVRGTTKIVDFHIHRQAQIEQNKQFKEPIS
ncbi:sugar transferase [Priestia flexa]|uniref:sugar transferase n=1 Tax=Priestia flexa TaxID=86664 RepID=UPI0032EAB219